MRDSHVVFVFDMRDTMQLQKPTPELSAAISRHIAAYIADCASPYHRLAAAHGVLPLYYGWGTDFGLLPDGSVVRFDEDPTFNTDVWYGRPEMEASAVAFGALRHPELKQLFPPRPQATVDCDPCATTGFLDIRDTSALCGQCHGLGWHV